MKMKNTTLLSLVPIAMFALPLTSCDVDKVEDGEMPEVKIEGEAKLPKYEVEGPDVKVEKKTIEVPTLDVDLPEEEDDGAPATEPQTEPEEE